MIQNDSADFTVLDGEQVTVNIEAFGCSCNTGGAIDSQPLGTVSHSPDVYSFSLSGDSQSQHTFTYVCHFFDADLDGAHYVVSASGNRGGGTFRVRFVAKQTDPPALFEIDFTIA